MSATVMIPTFRRPQGLARVLRALARQKDPGIGWDVLVIDNDPPNGRPAFDGVAAGLPVRARVVDEPVNGSAHARNRGISEITAEITVMLDDDVQPADDWLVALLEPILEGRCDATGGRVLLDPEVPLPSWFDARRLGGYLAQWDPAEQERYVQPDETLVTSNCAFDTAILRRAGGFDPGLGPRAGNPLVNDDVLLTRRVRAVGGRIRFVPDAVVVHDLPAARLRAAYLLRRAYAHGRSDWILEAEALSRGRAKGAGAALRALGAQLGRRLREGIARPEVAFHAACDVSRAAGCLRESLAALVRRGVHLG